VGFNPLFGWAPVAVWLWGILLIARERMPNTLEFLAAAPVSRREIAVAKFFFGTVSIVGMMTVNLLFVLGLSLVAPAGYTLPEALFWYVYCVSFLLSIFSLGFLIAVVTGNWMASLGAAVLYFLLSRVIFGVIHFFAVPMGIPDPALARIRVGMEYADPFTYLQIYQSGQAHMGHVTALFAVFLVLGILSLRLFEANPLEKNGQAFMFGNSRLFWGFFIPLIPAVMVGYVFNISWISALFFGGLAYVAGIRVADYLMRQLKGYGIGAR
jgi:hypothetical protein